MAIPRQDLWRLGAEDCFALYEAEFMRVYRTGPVRDPLGRLVEFPPHACAHICFVTSGPDRYRRTERTVWDQARAERAGWAFHALTDPSTEIRPSYSEPRRELYILCMEGTSQELPTERYMVCVHPKKDGGVVFLSAYPIDLAKWVLVRNGWKALYPETKSKPKRKRR